ncbi:MAG: helix-turn-helix transcriptional regulator [Firmicutes bacterium]|uniref:HTH cro/C1-type domain-containing protein n=1 Tax=Kroppenstedtia guangzhouensis TaxID=1274356 RepID=A0ABQ1GMQ4_9BACL|nr:helix-turn-helix transcriptional regulator [Kroppenstedtia guangzhouensis]MDA8353628.1 helix-turn-helix transcriptional regulator [Bacillota bacterium]TMZ63884.1 XRE family transcriptional regulator [Klebsiella pneumoniae]GGA46873.1 hypothetical protein GCM10007416_20060 [Kroppenstedtia guangzhouensis]
MRQLFLNLKALSNYRSKKRISMREMAEALGLKTPGGYARIESGNVKLKAEHLPIIAKMLGLTIVQLVTLLFYEDDVEETSSKTPKKITA